ncbi:hypothetical protein [Clostridium felsineum]|uniref:Uncharacterized protein n=1 Tax=Clostridium felsineum TaxID=36839 RepID=A0A1S8LRF6_9CLOT|nr:hypothetical protein [Clostridium felsineum]URZ05966.1 hypothetical protein CLROS_012980 [Clostridium felsineum]URZ11003.1 hypothetical protein CROST_017190 [Clostridium felsineum]
MKNIIENIKRHLGYIFKGNKMEEEMQNIQRCNQEFIDLYKKSEEKNKELENKIEEIKKRSEEEKKEHEAAQEKIINENVDLRYFINEVLPEILKNNNFMDKNTAYSTFLKVVKRGSFEEKKKKQSKIVLVK